MCLLKIISQKRNRDRLRDRQIDRHRQTNRDAEKKKKQGRNVTKCIICLG